MASLIPTDTAGTILGEHRYGYPSRFLEFSAHGRQRAPHGRTDHHISTRGRQRGRRAELYNKAALTMVDRHGLLSQFLTPHRARPPGPLPARALWGTAFRPPYRWAGTS